jgi:hypothetical protein
VKSVIILSVISILSYSVAGYSEIVLRKSVKVTSEIPRWNDQFIEQIAVLKEKDRYPKTGYTECAPTAELPNAIICLSHTRAQMNALLARVSGFVEGLMEIPKGEVIAHDDPRIYELGAIGGHDLQKKDVIAFLRKSQSECKRAKNFCLSVEEQEIFKRVILPHYYSRKTENLVIVTYAIQNGGMSYKDVVTHEIMHAQYFLDPIYQQVVDGYWDAMPEQEKSAVKRVLGAFYNQDDAFLMKNEFQAYILMANAEGAELRKFVPTYRKPLTEALLKKGVQPLQVQ